ncbi:MAG: TRAP transporter small permease [Candidatus Competibacterales bacterium]
MTPSRRLRLADRCETLSLALNRLVEHTCAALLVVLILDVWLGVFVRRVVPLPITFTEELARYLMIWTALLAVSCGIARREHIGITALFDQLPHPLQRGLQAVLDLLALGFFALLCFYGLGLVDKGEGQFTMIYGMTKALPFAAVPTAAALACIQLILVGLKEQLRGSVTGPARREVAL